MFLLGAAWIVDDQLNPDVSQPSYYIDGTPLLVVPVTFLAAVTASTYAAVFLVSRAARTLWRRGGGGL